MYLNNAHLSMRVLLLFLILLSYSVSLLYLAPTRVKAVKWLLVAILQATIVAIKLGSIYFIPKLE